jgi:tetratricopeptide (TPR) repeat protein
MNRYILFWIITAMVIASCSNRSKVDKRIIIDYEQGTENEERFSKLLEDKDNLLKINNGEQLTKTGCNIYSRIGVPEFSQDTQRLNFAIELLNKAIKIDASNVNAFYCKFNIQTAMQNWKEALQSINKIIQISAPDVDNFIFQGSVYEMLNKPDSSIIAFKNALLLFDKKTNLGSNDQMLVDRAIIIAFIYGKEEAIKELCNSENRKNDEYLEIARDQIFSAFNKRTYIEESIFKRPVKLN